MSDQAAARSAADSEVADAVEAAGHFRIYLGAAAGVGKTYAMLNEGHRRMDRGTDIVIGFVECHGRRLTEVMIEGLEVIPRKQVDYRGSRLEEMDVDAVISRRMAARLKGELDVIHVASSDATQPADQKSSRKLEELTAVGARWHEVPGDDPVRAITRFAQEHQITQIVVGSSQRSRWQQLLGGGSNVTRVIREAGALGIDVHVIALRKAPRAGPTEETADGANRLVEVRTSGEADSIRDPEDQ